MKLSPKAAIEVCNEASEKGLWILGIDGGHWLNPGFRIDSSTSWTYSLPEEYKSKIPENNRLAIENIKDDIVNGYTAFIITLKM
ncbi:TPA: colicin transporter [Escherichia coli]|nr:colicin transporter [Escherichia coli]EKO9111431.1 colicin transporter [Escherichia coli]HAO6722131.1 colicin transporter [Escherichia coli]HAZ3586645.1 colicin transporter [Escherichia coli]HAZ3685191.1 colicin transporter [Escherichia coli]